MIVYRSAAVGLTVAIAASLVRQATQRQEKEQELRGEADEQRRRADRYLYFSRINLAHRAWQEAHIARMDELLEQTRPEHTGGEDLGGFERGYLQHLREASLLTLKGHTDLVESVAFSLDGQRLASAGWDWTVRIWDATPVSEESNQQRQAVSYFRFVAETVVLKDDMIQQIRSGHDAIPTWPQSRR